MEPVQEVEQTSHEESCVFARKVIASGDNNERGRQLYLRVSRVDKPCEETMRVGARSAPHKRRTQKKAQQRDARDSRAVRQGRREYDREQASRTEHAWDATP